MAPASQEPEPASPTTTRPDSESSVESIAQVCRPYLHAIWDPNGARGRG
ncbi:hypothetical protein CMUS01_01141 [Colletotrichum musicola]|uniref:Uncharacterized protein n=2 Tax=Colletotrichum orchidearum species complex TaxID=2707337 RepID=A0A8H6NXC7_9PEZI|nr:hypothetical protein CPLU01_00667 [Colletotrichum plurivorum]KAF6844367.1 hypothetical protein CMUS01_01141 [Colletotrichum musicola]